MSSRISAPRPARGGGRLALIAGAALILALFVATLLPTLIPTDPEQEVGAVRISDVPAALPPGEALDRRVTGLDEVSGLVAREDPDDVDELVVGRVELDFGPDDWIAGAGPLADYDGDGAAEALRDELSGLVGRQVRFLARLDSRGDDGDVYAINGRPYRDAVGPPPWNINGGREEDIRRAAAAAVGEGAAVKKLETADFPAAWEAEVVDAAGREYKVDLAADGRVLGVEAD
jgi:hypothetical protein